MKLRLEIFPPTPIDHQIFLLPIITSFQSISRPTSMTSYNSPCTALSIKLPFSLKSALIWFEYNPISITSLSHFLISEYSHGLPNIFTKCQMIPSTVTCGFSLGINAFNLIAHEACETRGEIWEKREEEENSIKCRDMHKDSRFT